MLISKRGDYYTTGMYVKKYCPKPGHFQVHIFVMRLNVRAGTQIAYFTSDNNKQTQYN